MLRSKAISKMMFPFAIICMTIAAVRISTTDAFILPHYATPPKIRRSTLLLASSPPKKDASLLRSFELPKYEFDYEAAKAFNPPAPINPNAKRAEKPTKRNLNAAPPAPLVEPPSPRAILQEEAVKTLARIKKNIMNQSKAPSVTSVFAGLDPGLGSAAPLLAAPIVVLVSLRATKARREKIEAEKALVEAARLAKANQWMQLDLSGLTKLKESAIIQKAKESVVQSSSEAVRKTKEVALKIWNDAVNKLKEVNVDVDRNAVGKTVGAVGAGVVALGLIAANKPASTSTQDGMALKNKKAEPVAPVKYVEEMKPPKEEKKVEVVNVQKADIAPIADTKPVQKPKSQNAVISPKPNEKVKADGVNDLTVPVGVASLAAIATFRLNLMQGRNRREEMERLERMKKFNMDMDYAINTATNAATELEDLLGGATRNTKDSELD